MRKGIGVFFVEKIRKLYNSKFFSVYLFVIYFTIIFSLMLEYPCAQSLPVKFDGIGTINVLTFIKNVLLKGEFPLWNPMLSNGVPCVSDITTMSFYPIKYLFLFLPTEWFWVVFYAVHLSFGAVFMYHYCNLIKCDKVISLLTSIIYLFSIHLGGIRKEHLTLILCTVYLPAILYFIESYLQSSKRKYLLISSIFMGLQFLIGFPQYTVYTDILAGCYLIGSNLYKKNSLKKWFKDALIWGVSYIGIISVQLVMFFQMTMYYLSSGASNMSFEIFSSLSIHPVRYLMMLFPRLFEGQPWQYTSGLDTSGMDIEVFLGTFVFAMALYGMIYFYKDVRILGAGCIVCVMGLFASSGNIPILGRIIYRIPLLGSFRVPSRVLFILFFFAYVIFAVTLTKLVQSGVNKKCCTFLKTILEISGVLMIAHLSCALMINGKGTPIIQYQDILSIYYRPMLVLLIMLVGLRLAQKKSNKSIIYILLTVFTIINLYEVYPYWKDAMTTSVSKIGTETAIEKKLQVNLEKYKLLVATARMDAGAIEMISEDRNLSMGINAINSYISINNPRLSKLMTSESIIRPSYNYSGLYCAFFQVERNLFCQNDLLSMLGVKYIIDQDGYLNGRANIYEKEDDREEIYTSNEVISFGNYDEALVLPIDLQPRTYYDIEIELENETDVLIVGDLYQDALYNDFTQDFSVNIKNNVNEYKITVFSGETEEESSCLRMWLSEDNIRVDIQKLSIYKCNTKEINNIYSSYYEDDLLKIYENKNVCPLLYVPEEVKRITAEDEIYNNPLDYSLRTVSYCSEIASGFSCNPEKTFITNIRQKTNSVTAEIVTEKQTFVNFSQNYFPGWKAYIDGNDTPIYMVNGLIQGIEVPVGIHEIKFVYKPVLIYFSAFGSILSLLLVGFAIKKDTTSKRKEK